MAQTENGQKIYDYFLGTVTMEFADIWTEFSVYYSHINNKPKNYTAEWWKWCDEFAEWVLNGGDFEEGAYDLVKEETNG
jgi:hypothetical protein